MVNECPWLKSGTVAQFSKKTWHSCTVFKNDVAQWHSWGSKQGFTVRPNPRTRTPRAVSIEVKRGDRQIKVEGTVEGIVEGIENLTFY